MIRRHDDDDDDDGTREGRVVACLLLENSKRMGRRKAQREQRERECRSQSRGNLNASLEITKGLHHAILEPYIESTSASRNTSDSRANRVYFRQGDSRTPHSSPLRYLNNNSLLDELSVDYLYYMMVENAGSYIIYSRKHFYLNIYQHCNNMDTVIIIIWSSLK